MSDAEPFTLKKDMAVTHGEFMRGMERLLSGAGVSLLPSATDDEMRIPWGAGTVNIRIGPQSARRLGMISLPSTLVTLTFGGLSRPEREDFVAQFDRRFQRAGG